VPVTEGFAGHAARTPDRPALAIGDTARSYGALWAAATRAAALVAAAPDPQSGGRRVGLLLGNRVEFLEGFLGALLSGAAAMVLDPKWTAAERVRVLAATPPGLLIADPTLLDRAAAPALPALRILPPDAWRDHPPAAALPAVADDAPFYIGFTSGTTGRPKGFVRSHRSWLESFAAGAAAIGIGPDDRVLAPGPLVHSLFLYAALEALHAGATVHLQPRFDAAAALDTIARHGITRLVLVPTMVAALAEAAGGRGPWPSVRAVICSGAKWPPALKARVPELFPNAAAIEFYGASELSFVSVLHGGGPPDSVGRPFPGVTVAIRRDDGTAAAPGEVGRLWVRSALLFGGYLEPDDGGSCRIEDGWATVGDLAQCDADGFIHLAGREGDRLITGGLNVWPAEIEAVLCAQPEIAEAAVLGLPDPYWGDLVCAAIAWRGPARLSAAALRDRCRARLAAYKCPRRFVALPALPHTESGKVARAALRERVLTGAPDVADIA
jgi:long-chain acyl-CoA synthetase